MSGWRRFSLKSGRLVVWSLVCLMAGFAAGAFLDPPSAIEAETASLSTPAPGSFSPLVKKVSPGVVNISTVKVIRSGQIGRTPFGPFGQNDPFKDFFDQFFRNQMPRDYRQKSLGSGFIIDKNGYILTNNHVIEKTDEIKVRLSDDREYTAEVIGRDSKTDLALIRIKADGPLTPLPLGDSDKVEPGDQVLAIGNPFGLGNTVTAGIVSAKYRQIGAGAYDNFIQTDASINPGNSGGPLLNTRGEVIGIDSAIFSQGGGSIGIGFAIPINMAKDLLPQLKKGKVVRGWLGVMIQKVTPELRDKLGLKTDKGALVADVNPDGPAAKAGVKRGDVITSFDGKAILEMNDLPYLVATTPVGQTAPMEIFRKNQTLKLKVTVGELKEEQDARTPGENEPEIGLTVEDIGPELQRQFDLSESRGIVVVDVENGSPADEAGLKPGDVVLEIDQKPVRDLDAFYSRLQKYKKGDTILFLVNRSGSTLYLTLNVWE